jgi:adenosylcobinamide-GDP ribazoletransferase
MGSLVANAGDPRVSQAERRPHPKNNPGDEKMPLATPGDLLLALSLLSRLPLPEPERHDWSRQAQAVWAYPLAGAALGGMACLAGLLGQVMGLPSALVALVTLAVLIIASGAMHEDGLADCADGFWGGWTPERRLEIMKDSRIGTYGMIAIVLSLIARWAALWLLWQAGVTVAVPAILSAAMLSRAGMPVLMARLPHARADGLSRGIGRAPGSGVWLGIAVALGAGLLLIGTGVIIAGLWAGLALAGWAALARRKIGGQTGDVLGASQQILEITVLLVLLVLLP